MKVLLDEDVPVPLISLIQHLLRGHDVLHIKDLKWNGKKDPDVYKDAKARGFDAIVTNDLKQLDDPRECRAIRRSGLHHIRYDLQNGLSGLGLATGAVCAAILPVIDELVIVGGQRLVHIRSLSGSTSRYSVQDPTTDPPAYWP